VALVAIKSTRGCSGASRASGSLRMLKIGEAISRPLDGIARLDRDWFLVNPKRDHRCRRPAPCELDLYDYYRGGRLVVAVRHLGRGRVLYQPVIFQGALPSDERSSAAIFALAAKHPDPIPQVAALDWLTVLSRLGWAYRRLSMARDL
jgi:hypothetical protein